MSSIQCLIINHEMYVCVILYNSLSKQGNWETFTCRLQYTGKTVPHDNNLGIFTEKSKKELNIATTVCDIIGVGTSEGIFFS